MTHNLHVSPTGYFSPPLPDNLPLPKNSSGCSFNSLLFILLPFDIVPLLHDILHFLVAPLFKRTGVRTFFGTLVPLSWGLRLASRYQLQQYAAVSFSPPPLDFSLRNLFFSSERRASPPFFSARRLLLILSPPARLFLFRQSDAVDAFYS